MNNETIYAMATPAGGALGIIRISGEKAIPAVEQIFVSAAGKPLSERPSHTVIYGTLHTESGETIDDVVVTLFKAPHSYTGDDSVEITCHGSPYILQQVMQQLLLGGCRQAHAGEFTQRAFLNGKMDLCRAEAVADLIASVSAASHRLAMSQLRGGFGDRLRDLRMRLLHLLSLVELELDFGEEDVEFADREQLCSLISEVYILIDDLVHSFKVGNAVKNGVPVAIVGEPNSGKSTLLNQLLNEERAIVSDISGTTRDTIEETLNLKGTLFRLIDTAGLRDTRDAIEKMGIQRTLQALEKSTIVLWMIDSTIDHANAQALHRKIEECGRTEGLILLFNKCDLIHETQRQELHTRFASLNFPMLFISAKQKQNLEELQDTLVKTAAIPQITQNDVIVTNIRHYEALTLAREAIARVRQGVQNALSSDLLSQDLRDCIFHLSDILGEVTNDEVLKNIFKNFCIGK